MELSRNEKILLKSLKGMGGKAKVNDLVEKTGLSVVEVMNAASWLKMKGALKINEDLKINYILSEEGKKSIDKGLPERKLFNILKEKGASKIDDLKNILGKETVSLGIAHLKNNGIMIKDGTIYIIDEKKAENTIKEIEDNLKNIESLNREKLDYLLKRNLVEKKEKVERELVLTQIGENVKDDELKIKEEITQITPELIQTGAWKEKELRKYDIKMFAPFPEMGRTHPLSEFIEKVRRIFLNMGFKEIYGQYVVSAFWNMDALYIPQDHPAREMQDTFYMDGKFHLPDYYQIVKKVHENGNGISRGWKYKWEEELARMSLLRTHTTVNSIKYLYDHRDENIIRVFTIGRVFRRENMDSTHLPEFHQIEGIMMEENTNFSMLLGTLQEFYSQLGFKQIKFKPSYFPYTEPSLEIHVLKDNKWLELGGAGIFRPEVTEPMGIKHKVLAWGLGLERLAMLYYGIKDIRDLYIADIEQLRSLPIL
ncbi:MAG: phenylalanine--tRNA ligase subunit alpha [Thermoplasmata archaeon]|nr:phenylalanine--tRNA ligase subunit alpha [Thermoplasmata archaeon]